MHQYRFRIPHASSADFEQVFASPKTIRSETIIPAVIEIQSLAAAKGGWAILSGGWAVRWQCQRLVGNRSASPELDFLVDSLTAARMVEDLGLGFMVNWGCYVGTRRLNEAITIRLDINNCDIAPDAVYKAPIENGQHLCSHPLAMIAPFELIMGKLVRTYQRLSRGLEPHQRDRFDIASLLIGQDSLSYLPKLEQEAASDLRVLSSLQSLALPESIVEYLEEKETETLSEVIQKITTSK